MTKNLSRLITIAVIAAPFILCLWYVDSFGVDVPAGDSWISVDLLKRLYSGDINWISIFFTQVNQHMVGLPYLLMIALARCTAYNIRCELFSSLFFLFGACFLLLLMTKKRAGGGQSALLAMVPVSWLACSLRQYENLLSGYQVAVFMCVFFFLLTVYLLDRVERTGVPLLLSMAAAFCCAFSFGNGVLVVPLGALQLTLTLLTCRRSSRREAMLCLGGWALFSVAILLLYFAHFKRPAAGDAITFEYFRNHLQDMADYFSAYLGGSLSGSGEAFSAMSIGVVLCGILAVASICLAGSPGAFVAEMVAPLVLILFAVGSDCLTLIGRGQYGVLSAMTPRYVTISYLYMAGLYLFLLSARKLVPNVRTCLLGGIAALLVAGTTVSVRDGILCGMMARRSSLMNVSLLRTYKWQDMASLVPLNIAHTAEVVRLAPFLEEHQLSVFRDRLPAKAWTVKPPPIVHLGGIVSSPLQAAEGLYIFSVDGTKEKNMSFWGWAVDSRTRSPAGGLVISLDDKLDIPVVYGLEAPEAASVLKKSSSRRCGFWTSFLTTAISPGCHTVSFKVLSPDGTRFYKTTPIALLQVFDSAGRFFSGAGRTVYRATTSQRLRDDLTLGPSCTFSNDGDAAVRARGGPPQIFLPDVGACRGSCRMVRMQLSVPTKTLCYLYYTTARDSTYSWQKRVTVPVDRGENVIYTMLPGFCGGRLELAPGTCPGVYKIAQLEIKDCL